MKFLLYLFLTPISNKVITNYSGENHTPLIKNETDISVIHEFYVKHNLLKKLQNDKVSTLTKLDLIYSSHLLDSLNNNIIKPPNLFKGLELDFDFDFDI